MPSVPKTVVISVIVAVPAMRFTLLVNLDLPAFAQGRPCAVDVPERQTQWRPYPPVPPGTRVTALRRMQGRTLASEVDARTEPITPAPWRRTGERWSWRLRGC
jgi:hypothetical protein